MVKVECKLSVLSASPKIGERIMGSFGDWAKNYRRERKIGLSNVEGLHVSE